MALTKFLSHVILDNAELLLYGFFDVTQSQKSEIYAQ